MRSFISRLHNWWLNLPYYLKPAVRYALITGLGEDENGNRADEFLMPREFWTGFGPDGDIKEMLPTVVDDPTEEDYKSSIRVRLPVFTLGEILLVNRSGREICGRGRKPSKWYVQCEYFWTLRGALKRYRKLEEEEAKKP